MFYLSQGRIDQKGKCDEDSQTDIARPSSHNLKKPSSRHHQVRSSPLNVPLWLRFRISWGFIQIYIPDLQCHYNNGLSYRQSSMAAQRQQCRSLSLSFICRQSCCRGSRIPPNSQSLYLIQNKQPDGSGKETPQPMEDNRMSKRSFHWKIFICLCWFRSFFVFFERVGTLL